MKRNISINSVSSDISINKQKFQLPQIYIKNNKKRSENKNKTDHQIHPYIIKKRNQNNLGIYNQQQVNLKMKLKKLNIVSNSSDMISSLLKEKKIYNQKLKKNLNRKNPSNNFERNINFLLDKYSEESNLFNKGNSHIKQIKINELINETMKDNDDNMFKNKEKQKSLKDLKKNTVKIDYDLLSQKSKMLLKSEQVNKMRCNTKLENLLIYSPGEWRKNRNCSLRYLYNKSKKSIKEAKEMLQNIDREVKITVEDLKKEANETFGDNNYINY